MGASRVCKIKTKQSKKSLEKYQGKI